MHSSVRERVLACVHGVWCVCVCPPVPRNFMLERMHDVSRRGERRLLPQGAKDLQRIIAALNKGVLACARRLGVRFAGSREAKRGEQTNALQRLALSRHDLRGG